MFIVQAKGNLNNVSLHAFYALQLKSVKTIKTITFLRRQDTQYNNTQHNDIKHTDSLQK